MTLTSSSATITERHSPIGTAARLDDVVSLQVEKSVLHDAALTQIAVKVLRALDDWVRWETATGADSLRALMPEFRRTALGYLETDRCPHDDQRLEQFEEADEHGVYMVFQCAGSSHTFRALPFTNGEVPDFSEFES